ncbi:HPr-rel-A system PqqD family peptide chaperone [Chitinimonas sp.]|uniref:HPr-rel-A system PqqD family peptide chaperone n=1 Tax=Chitinimonas sp. TaxID=1934313 RepID=UPI002F93B548
MLAYILEPSGRFLLHVWEEEALVFDTCSGDTHMLDPVATALVGRLGESGLDLPALQRWLDETFVLPDQQAASTLAEAALLNLRAIGLVRLVPLEDR